MDFTMERVSQMLALLKKHWYYERQPLIGWRFSECGYKTDNRIPDSSSDAFRDFGADDRWGNVPDAHAWFCRHVVIPESWRGKEVRFALATDSRAVDPRADIDLPQTIAYINGTLTQGMDINHTEIILPDLPEMDMALYLYSAKVRWYKEFHAELRLVNEECIGLYYDLQVPSDVLKFSDPNSKTYADVLSILNNAINRLDCREPGSGTFFASVRDARIYLHHALYTDYTQEQRGTVICIGHTHIDVAWLWTLEQTREKVQRSFSTVLQMMKQYPEYKFMSSQPQLYAFLKEECPELYAEVKKMVAAGRWEVEGAMWLEADCNLTSGESLVRQVLFGKRFFKQEFGVDSRVLWLPDVFGYSAAMPQILKKSGVDYFVTSKISWNETNMMPYDMFRWRGIDGTEIFSWFLTAQKKKRGEKPVTYTTYVSDNDPDTIAGTWERFQQKEFSDQVINTYGYGDGGGGPTMEMVEKLRRMKKGFGELPNARVGTVGEFLNHVAKEEHNPKLPVWDGELYMEMHRGTYTSIARNKRNNRKCEFAYQNAELLSVLGKLLAGLEYPQEKLNRGWERVLLYQFHDIIPGSSIKEVYEDCDRVYPLVLQNANDISAEAETAICKLIHTDGGVAVFNPHSFENNGVVRIDGQARFVEHIPPKGYAVVQPSPLKNSVFVRDHEIENEFYLICFDENYEIRSIFDKKAQREVIDSSRGTANRLEVYEDYPRAFDAWEITNYYKEKEYAFNQVESVTSITDGARAGLKICRRFLESTLEQIIWVYEDLRRIDFETKVDWHQNHLLMKAAFPVKINASRATYEIQFGTLERPTHFNTSWDAAKFEVCAHKYCDLSEYDYGVALLNDCKYGHDVHDGIMRLTLLKSATYPSPVADQGEHIFTYSLVPHQGDYRATGIVRMAYDLNQPMTAIQMSKQAGVLPDTFSLVSVSAENVILETVKKAEDSDDMILRMYEAYNKRTQTKVTLPQSVKHVFRCDLMENEIEGIPVSHGTVAFEVKPFEIITLKVRF